MKNNKGFTLIELLITVVMMLSLTILVVVGFTKVSDSKKEEADKLSENQIVNAAEQYFSSEYYWIEYLKSDKADNGEIHVNLAKLIKEDYLNVVSSTKTEEKFSRCDKVVVTYKNNKLKFKYVKDTENQTDCNPSIKLAGPIDIKFTVKSGNITLPDNKINGTNWYNTNVKLKIDLKVDENYDNIKLEDTNIDNHNFIKNIKVFVNDVEKENKNFNSKNTKNTSIELILNKDDIHKVRVVATNYMDNPSTNESDYYIDKTKPDVSINTYTSTSDKKGFTDPATINSSKKLNSGTWTNKNVYLASIGEDTLSGIHKSGSSCTYNTKNKNIISGNSGNTYNSIKTKYGESAKYGLFLRYNFDEIDTVTCTFQDKAGNKSKPTTFVVKRDNTDPSLVLSSFKSKDLSKIENHIATSIYKSADWYSGYVDVIAEAKDSMGKVTLRYQRTKDEHGGSEPRDKSKSSDGANKKAIYKTYSKAEGTSYYIFTATDEAGNSKTETYTVRLDRTAPTCTVTPNGTKGNPVNDIQWYLTNDVSVSLSQKDDQTYRSGLDTYGLSTGSKTYNKETTGTQSAEGLVTWNCYVKDKAGNEGNNSKTFGLEKTVEIKFVASLTNKTGSENISYGSLVFNEDKTGPCGYGNCSNIKCYTNSNKTDKCAKGRFARACRYVKSYPRFFEVTAVSEYPDGTKTVFAEDSDLSEVTIDEKTYKQNTKIVRSEDVKRDNASDEFDSKYYFRNVGDKHGSGTNDFSAHKYQYTSPAGLKSNEIRLYTEYSTECY